MGLNFLLKELKSHKTTIGRYVSVYVCEEVQTVLFFFYGQQCVDVRVIVKLNLQCSSNAYLH